MDDQVTISMSKEDFNMLKKSIKIVAQAADIEKYLSQPSNKFMVGNNAKLKKFVDDPNVNKSKDVLKVMIKTLSTKNILQSP